MVRRSSRIQKLSLAESAESEGPCVVPTQKKPAPKRQGKGEKRKRGEGREQSVPAKPCNAVEQMRAHERAAVAGGAQMVAGVDEAGRGPLAGPVVAAACHVPLDFNPDWLDRINDSKGVKEDEREELYEKLIVSPGVIWAQHTASAARIDEINILQATMECMHNAVAKLKQAPDHVLIDGNRSPWGHPEAVRANGTVRPADPPMPPGVKEGVPIIKGDAKVLSIAAASIIAKVTRDRLMRELALKHPEYGFDKHKGFSCCYYHTEKGKDEREEMTHR